MKKLQNDFTTPEQSKRLLDLGVPTDSADCYLTRFGMDEDWEVKVLNNVKYSELAISNQKYCLPCWSVGRLIEITAICREWFEGQKYHSYTFQKDISPLEKAIEKIEIAVRENRIDFSKLEE